eukprot:1160996-Pelagomonas_calceolata.AAC.5
MDVSNMTPSLALRHHSRYKLLIELGSQEAESKRQGHTLGSKPVNRYAPRLQDTTITFAVTLVSAELVPFGETCCALGLRVCALSQPNSPPVCPNPPAEPPSLQVDPRACPECTWGHLLQAGRGLFWGALKRSKVSGEEC